jgi:hypothetical protein
MTAQEQPTPEATRLMQLIRAYSGKAQHFALDDREAALRVDHFAREARAKATEEERTRLGFGEIVMMSEQRGRPGSPPRWSALACGSKRAAIADSEEEARITALVIRALGDKP